MDIPALPEGELIAMGLHDMILDGADQADIFWLVLTTQDPECLCAGAWAYCELWDVIRDHYGGDPRPEMEHTE